MKVEPGKEADNGEVMPILVSAESPRNGEVTPYMTYDVNQKRARYFIDRDETSYELTQQEYRDVLATLAIDLRADIAGILDNIDLKAFGDWVDRITEIE